jgi:hypothetical protein
VSPSFYINFYIFCIYSRSNLPTSSSSSASPYTSVGASRTPSADSGLGHDCCATTTQSSGGGGSSGNGVKEQQQQQTTTAQFIQRYTWNKTGTRRVRETDC